MKQVFWCLLLFTLCGCAVTPQGPWGDWKAQNDRFMRDIARTEGVTCTASGLCYRILSQGTDAPPDDNDYVVLSYKQTLINGSPVQSYDNASPARFPVGKVLEGMVEALKLMKAPADAQIYIPAHLGFGDRGAGTKVPPWSALVLEAELMRVDRVD